MQKPPDFLKRLRRRIAERPIPRAAPNRWGIASTAILSLLVGLMGGFVGNTLVESGKSADNLRRYVLAELFRPYLEKSANCSQRRKELRMYLTQVSYTIEAGLAAQPSSPQQANPEDTSAAKAYLTQAQGHLERAAEKDVQLRTCISEVATLMDVLSVAMDITSESKQILTRSKTRGDEIVSKYFLGKYPALEASYGATNIGISQASRTLVKKSRNKAQEAARLSARNSLTLIAEFMRTLANYHIEAEQAEQQVAKELGLLYFKNIRDQHRKSMWELITGIAGPK